ncbi:MAG: hypothetical protein HN522_01515 [Flavobacteriales bacterium]|nr:hypothetical protein [Flavobacteriales bacterium]
MKKLLFIFFSVPLSLLYNSCSSSGGGVPSPILEDVIVDQIWEIKDGTERFYLNSNDGKLYGKDFLCDDFLIIGDWILDGNNLSYHYFDGSLEITELLGEVETFSVDEIKFNIYDDSTTQINLVFKAVDAAILGCMDTAAVNYNPAAECDDETCINPTGKWEIIPSCPYYEVFGIQINVEERFDDYMFIVSDSNKLNIDFGSDQTAYAEIDITGQLIIPNQTITLDFQDEGYDFIDVEVYGDGSVNTDIGIGILNLTFVFEILPGSIEETSCVLTIDKQ